MCVYVCVGGGGADLADAFSKLMDCRIEWEDSNSATARSTTKMSTHPNLPYTQPIFDVCKSRLTLSTAI